MASSCLVQAGLSWIPAALTPCFFHLQSSPGTTKSSLFELLEERGLCFSFPAFVFSESILTLLSKSVGINKQLLTLPLFLCLKHTTGKFILTLPGPLPPAHRSGHFPSVPQEGLTMHAHG